MMSRITAGLVWVGVLVVGVLAPVARGQVPAARPNIVLILCDDLGWGELGCYGQTKIPTPNIDRLAAEGLRFTTFYSGSPVCAPSRCVLLTGKHTGHTDIRDNEGYKPEGQRPIRAETVLFPALLKEAGYATACVGKWGLGPYGTGGDPNKHGFDHYFGHICQSVAHNQWAPHVWSDGRKVMLDNPPWDHAQKTPWLAGKQYTPDVMADDAVRWLKAHAAEKKGQPFFLYFATPLPHLALQAPEEAVAKFRGKIEDKPYVGGKGYIPNETPHATYAAMVNRIDDYVGRLVATVKEMGQEDNTVFLFTSDNGPTLDVGGADSPFFESAKGLRGLKQDVYEGGIRVPLIVRWPGKVKAGAVTGQVGAFWDVAPTLCELAGAKAPPETDGLSLVPTLLGTGEQRQHEFYYWEYHSQGGAQAVRMGDWKGVRTKIRQVKNAPVQLYDLAKDPGETTDVAGRHPEVVAKIKQVMKSQRTESDNPKWVVPAWE